MTDDDVHSALVCWLRGLTGVTVIKTHQSGPAPTGSYIAVNMTGTRQIRAWAQCIEYAGGKIVDGELTPVTASSVMEIEWQFSCHVYGLQPTGILRPVRSAIQLAQMHEPLLPNLVIHECSQVRNVPDWINEKWEPRGQMDIHLRGLTRDGFLIDVIEEAPITITGQ